MSQSEAPREKARDREGRPESSLTEIITSLEDQTWIAMQNHGSALIPFLAKDCIMLFPMGLKVSAKTKPDLNDVLYSEAFIPWKSYRMSNIEVVPIGDDGAVITYSVVAVRPPLDSEGDEEDEFRALIASTWRKEVEEGRWELVIHQQTPYEERDEM